MMDDYTYLEEVGRVVGDVGRNIGRGGFTTRSRGRGRGGFRGGFGALLGKREIFQQKMAMRDIDVELLSSGMERRTINQSTWDTRYVV